jgi:hypothetical protein
VYKDVNVRSDILETTGNYIHFKKKEIEDKWHNIKSQFSREMAKLNTSIKSGCGTAYVYTTPCYAFSSLKFIKEQYRLHQNRGADHPTSQVSTNRLFKHPLFYTSFITLSMYPNDSEIFPKFFAAIDRRIRPSSCSIQWL